MTVQKVTLKEAWTRVRRVARLRLQSDGMTLADFDETDLDCLALYGQTFYVPALVGLSSRTFRDETPEEANQRRLASQQKLVTYRQCLVRTAPILGQTGGTYADRDTVPEFSLSLS
jgi:hypothetical protein